MNSRSDLGHVVVVGGGVGGVSTVGALRQGGYDGRVTLVDAGEFPYDRPPLSKDYLAGACSSTDLWLQSPAWFDDNRIELRTRTSVAALRTAEGALELDDGSRVAADRVVLATGGRAARPPLPGADGDLVHTLRTIEDADRLHKALVPGARLLVVGAGLIGAEVASTALDLGCDVVLVDPVDPPLVAALGTTIATWLHDLHTARGVRVVRAGVESLGQDGAVLTARFVGQPDAAEFDVAVLGVGMSPDTSLAVAAGIEVDRGVVVDPAQRTANPAVLAVGDATRVRRDGVLLPRTEHWEAAQHDGKRAAASILGVAPPAETAPWFWSDRHHRHVEAIGHLGAADQVVLRGTTDAPSFAVFGLHEGRVVAAAAVDDPTAVRAARRMVDRRLAVDPGALADPTTDLRRLLRG
ncbi:FAD-dependent oxidoreductase [Klenkia sp. LSe6-5]|uniref:FAD-dependent oxidoreductase n=1 Tax=Klenkia sesuvii TaxID=3103137 RepID=A0ABU8DT24_9ACTN